MDKLDQMNRKNSMHGNLIKWWSVNLVKEEISSDNNTANENSDLNSEDFTTSERIPDFSELETEGEDLAKKILNENRRDNAFEKASLLAKDETESFQDDDALAKEAMANEIYERLMREAAADEAAKQAEIEAAKLAASN